MTLKMVLPSALNSLHTVNDFIHFAAKKLQKSQVYFGHGTDNPWDDACYLVLSLLRLPNHKIQKVLSKKLTLEQKYVVWRALKQRVEKKIPVAYLTQKAWFCGLPFYVDARVLIPRSPLAELIDKRFVPWVDPQKVRRILDIGTGSGCIAISCAKVFPRAKVDGVDVSAAALKVAKINCLRHKVSQRVRLIQSNLFAKLAGQTYDIIVSNPPYVGTKEMRGLPKEYVHEPKVALHAGKSGDEIIAKILHYAAHHLSPQGILVVEVGNSVSKVMKKYPKLPFVWLEFSCGESEVFLLTREQLKAANQV